MPLSGQFTAACGHVMPLGKHRGKTLARIGANKDGLLYLDWLIGQLWVQGELRESLAIYLKHPSIARQIDSFLEE